MTGDCIIFPVLRIFFYIFLPLFDTGSESVTGKVVRKREKQEMVQTGLKPRPLSQGLRLWDML